ncbi:MAG: ribonuclease H-like domain-containing protein [Myxococcota bacterium]
MALDFKSKLRLLDASGSGGTGLPSALSGSGAPGDRSHPQREASSSTRAPPPSSWSKADRIAQLRALMQEVAERPRACPDRAASGTEVPLPGELRSTTHGPIQLVEEFLEPSHRHGQVAIRDALDVDGTLVAKLALEPELAGVDFSRMVILDTETTGLSIASGTVPFLIGVAWFEDQSLCVQQLFLRRPGEEVPILQFLADRLRWASCLVTYNGKTFDWPLLRARYVLNRVPMVEPPAHLDLLHCARRIYRRRLQRVRLVHLEEAVLGMCREYDVDGAEIPRLYLDYLRRGEAGPLTGVIEHNVNDLVALAAILAKMSRHFARVVRSDDPRDHLSYAKLAVRSKDPVRARAFAEAAADGGGDSGVTVEALLLAATLARRRKDLPEEEQALEEAVEKGGEHPILGPTVHLAAAKCFEHRSKNFSRALVHAARTAPLEGPAGQEKRMARLRRRLARASEDS